MPIHIPLVIILLLFVHQVSAQTIVSKPVPFFYDLCSNEIWNFSQDSDGYVWVATTSGVARYDGHRLVTLRNNYSHPNVLSNNDVTIATDAGDYMWIGSRDGVTLLDKKNYATVWPGAEELRNANASEIVVQGSNVWVNASTNLIYRCSKSGELLKKYDLRNDVTLKGNYITINNLYVDHDGRLWALLGRHGLAVYNTQKDCFEAVALSVDSSSEKGGNDNASVSFYVMYQDAADRYWIGTWGNGLYEFNPKQPMAKRLKHHAVINPMNGKEDDVFYSIVEDDVLGYLWLLSYNSLYAFIKQSDGSLQAVDIDPYVQTHKMYTRIMKDREGNLWLSSYDDATIISFDETPIHNYQLPELSRRWGWDVNILEIVEDDDHVLWFNQDRLGIHLFDLVTGKLVFEPNVGPNSNRMLAKSRQARAMWVCDYNSSTVRKFVRNGFQISETESYDLQDADKNCGEVAQMIEDGDGHLWLTTTRGNVFAYFSGHVVAYPYQEGATAFLVADKDGVIWNLANGRRVLRMSLTQKGNGIEAQEVAHGGKADSNEKIQSACVDADGRIWAITSMGEVYRSNADKSGIQSMTLDGLLDDCTPLKILSEGDYLWFVTNKKIVRYNYRSESYVVYSVNDENMGVNVFRSNAAALDGRGGIYAGGHNGFIHIASSHDEKANRWNHAPVVSDVVVNGRSVVFFQQKNSCREVTLMPDDRNIEIFISSLKYGIGQRPRVAYMLEGVDEDYTYLSPEKHSAFYNRLDDGKYRLKVKYEYEPGRWSETMQVLTIVQKPAWYDTWWAYIVYSLIVLGIVYLLLVTPYEKIRLKRRIEDLMKKSHRHQTVMSKVPDLEAMNDADEDFLQRLIGEIEASIGDSEYDLTALAGSMSMSKSTLNRRVKALTDMTPSDFISSVRMKRAHQLLDSSQLSVSEVAYAVGFTNPKYFTKCFKKQFDCTPSEYKNKMISKVTR